MPNILSFVKLFSHEQVNELNTKTLYTLIEKSETYTTSSDNLLFSRTLMDDYIMTVAHRSDNGQTWLKCVNNNNGTYTEPAYEWQHRAHTLDDEDWDMFFISPEISLGTEHKYYRNAELARYPELLAFIAVYIAETLDDFKQMINDSIVTVDHEYDVFMISYTGNVSASRLGEYVFITGQQNGKLSDAIAKVMHNLDRYNSADIHLIPYIGTLVSHADFNTLTKISEFTQNIHTLNRLPNHAIAYQKAQEICEVVNHLNDIVEKTINERMKNHTQTVRYTQLMNDESVKNHLDAGGKVNLLLELSNMTWDV